jgi:hypothetical protein
MVVVVLMVVFQPGTGAGGALTDHSKSEAECLAGLQELGASAGRQRTKK